MTQINLLAAENLRRPKLPATGGVYCKSGMWEPPVAAARGRPMSLLRLFSLDIILIHLLVF
jgi:hypothetical protein